MSTIHPRITEVLTHTFKVPLSEIHPDSTMDSLEMDSLAVAEFAVLLRETVEGDTDLDRIPKDATLAEISCFIDVPCGSGERTHAEAHLSNAR
ncbi:acyl carrier protein [Streptomyces sp. NPDC052042]|uniref:acyl carrier protein n=1 Tax=Streptomyces sp. NPDC052042 TaxID=3365683 RepID=UPI0037D47E78